MSACTQIGEDIILDCNNRPKQGIEQNIILINEADLLTSGITLDATYPNALITGLALETGKTGFKIEGIKQILNFTNALVADEASEDGVTHSVTGIRIYDPSEEIRDEVNKYIAGTKVYAVLERKWKGVDNKHAFLFFGMTYGLMISEFTDNSADGTMVMSLATPSGMKEPYVPHVYRDTDYPTSKTAFDNKFSA